MSSPHTRYARAKATSPLRGFAVKARKVSQVNTRMPIRWIADTA